MSARIQQEINAITPLNAGRKKAEIAALLAKFFPRREKFETAVRKYQREINSLVEDNTGLKKEVDASKPGIKAQIEAANDKQELEYLRRFYANLPDEYKETYRPGQQKRHSKEVDTVL
jgi:hypothetical protein